MITLSIGNAEPMGEGMVACCCTFTSPIVFPAKYVAEYVVVKRQEEKDNEVAL